MGGLMNTYLDYNQHGNKMGSRVAPHNIVVSGVDVVFEGDISVKAFDLIRAKGLVAHSIVRRKDFRCVSEDAALEAAGILNENPVYEPEKPDFSRRPKCPECGRAMEYDGAGPYCEHCEG